MPRRTFVASITALVLCAVIAIDAAATSQRTFVASNGGDANPCSITLPCRSFGAAIAQTNAGGEVIVIDSAGYGPIAITQPVSIVAPPGVYAGVTVTSGTGITVNPGSGNVVLSGLTVIGLGGVVGISFQSGDSLRVERVTISGLLQTALSATLGAAGTLIIHDSALVANAKGLLAVANNGVLTLEIDGSRFEQNSTDGATLLSNVSGVATRSSFSKNSSSGVIAQPAAAGSANTMTYRDCVFSGNHSGVVTGIVMGTTTTAQVTDSEVSDNFVGIQPQSFSTVTVSNTTVTRNVTGLNYVGGTAVSFQDNRLYGNTTDGAFTSTIGKL